MRMYASHSSCQHVYRTYKMWHLHSNLLHVQMCLLTKIQHDNMTRKLLACHPPNSLTDFSVKKKKILLQSSSMLTVILNFRNSKGEVAWGEGLCVCVCVGGFVCAYFSSFLSQGVVWAEADMAAIVGMFCVAVFVSGKVSEASLVTVRMCEVHWDVLILGILPPPPWDQPIMPPACKCLAERAREMERVERARQGDHAKTKTQWALWRSCVCPAQSETVV